MFLHPLIIAHSSRLVNRLTQQGQVRQDRTRRHSVSLPKARSFVLDSPRIYLDPEGIYRIGPVESPPNLLIMVKLTNTPGSFPRDSTNRRSSIVSVNRDGVEENEINENELRYEHRRITRIYFEPVSNSTNLTESSLNLKDFNYINTLIVHKHPRIIAMSSKLLLKNPGYLK
jgi:hypothetical protein